MWPGSLNQPLITDTKVVSVIRCWGNGAILSADNLETSSISRCIFSVRFSWVILIFQRSKSPFYVARFLGQLLNFIFGRRLKSDHYRNFHTFEVAILTHQYQYTFTTPISLPLFIVLINIGLSAFPSAPILIFPTIPSKSLVLRSILLMHDLSFCS